MVVNLEQHGQTHHVHVKDESIDCHSWLLRVQVPDSLDDSGLNTAAATVEKLRVLFAQFLLQQVSISDNCTHCVTCVTSEFNDWFKQYNGLNYWHQFLLIQGLQP